MHYKQKLGYTILGAIITFVTLGPVAIVSPPLVAQNNGTFDQVRCSSLMVVDKNGEAAISLTSTDDYNAVIVADKTSTEAAIALSSEKVGNYLMINDAKARRAAALSHSRNTPNALLISNSDGSTAVGLVALDGTSNVVAINNKNGDPMISLQQAFQEGAILTVMTEDRERAIMMGSQKTFTFMNVHDAAKRKELGIATGSFPEQGNFVGVADREGGLIWSAPTH